MSKNKLKEKYKKLRNKLMKAKKVDLVLETENLEREFPISVIASTLENRLLCNYELLKDFWCFITNEEVDLSNISYYSQIIYNELINQYPDLKTLNYDRSKYYLSDCENKYIRNWYSINNGKTIKIKSLKKGCTKTLKIQD